MFFTYLRQLVLLFIVGGILIVSVNRVINPFNLFDNPSIQGINKIKTEFRKYQRMMKAFGIKYHHHNSIILGSSRAEYGLNTQHPGWGPNNNVYNLSLSAGNVYELLRYLELAQKVQPLERVVLGLDLFMFNAYRDTRPGFDEDRLHPKPKGKIFSYSMGDIMPALFSLDALYSSIETVRLQQDPPAIYLADGRKLPIGANDRVVKRGYRWVFEETEKLYIYEEWFQRPMLKFGFAGHRVKRLPFEEFRKIIQICQANNTELIIFISPSHASLWSTLKAAGLWNDFEEWKRRIVKIVDEETRMDNSNSSVPIWDFSGYHAITTEEVPGPGDMETKMKWYWDASHYTEFVGDLVLDKILNYRESERYMPKDFGIKMTTDGLDSHLLLIRDDQKRWEKAHPLELQQISKIIQSASHISFQHL